MNSEFYSQDLHMQEMHLSYPQAYLYAYQPQEGTNHYLHSSGIELAESAINYDVNSQFGQDAHLNCGPAYNYAYEPQQVSGEYLHSSGIEHADTSYDWDYNLYEQDVRTNCRHVHSCTYDQQQRSDDYRHNSGMEYASPISRWEVVQMLYEWRDSSIQLLEDCRADLWRFSLDGLVASQPAHAYADLSEQTWQESCDDEVAQIMQGQVSPEKPSNTAVNQPTMHAPTIIKKAKRVRSHSWAGFRRPMQINEVGDGDGNKLGAFVQITACHDTIQPSGDVDSNNNETVVEQAKQSKVPLHPTYAQIVRGETDSQVQDLKNL